MNKKPIQRKEDCIHPDRAFSNKGVIYSKCDKGNIERCRECVKFDGGEGSE